MNTSSKTNSTKKLVMWYKVNELFSNGLKFTQISQKLGIDRHRVSHYHQMSEAEFRLRRYLVGISKNISKSEEKELSVCNTSEVSSEEFDFSIERLSHGIG
jgi:hypothetical protein